MLHKSLNIVRKYLAPGIVVIAGVCVVTVFALGYISKSRQLTYNKSSAAVSNCPNANPNDTLPDDDTLNDCLFSLSFNGGGTLLLAPPDIGKTGYIIAKGLIYKANFPAVIDSIDSANSTQAPKKVVFFAAETLAAPMLVSEPGRPRISVYETTLALSLKNVKFDGNKEKRGLNTNVTCTQYRGAGSNIRIFGDDFNIDHIESSNALCGSALEVNGSRFEIASSEFYNNGSDHALNNSTNPDGTLKNDGPWADAITLQRCRGGYVHHNKIIDATDIGIVDGGGQNCRIEYNNIQNKASYGFAGIALHDFTNAGSTDLGGGDHTGSVYQYNTISVPIAPGTNKLMIGISVGMGDWYKNTHASGGQVINNTVSGAQTNLAVHDYSSGMVYYNNLSNPQGPNHPRNYSVFNATNSCLQPGWEVAISGQLPTTGTVNSNCSAFTPKPAVSGVLNSASFLPSIASGSIASVFGTNLATCGVKGQTATTNPLPTTLCDAVVKINGNPTSLFFVSQGQINFLVPSAFTKPTTLTVEVRGVISTSYPITIQAQAPGIYTQNASGTGLVSAQHFSTSTNPRYPNYTLITADKPAYPGDIVVMYLTGLGNSPISKPDLSINNTKISADKILFAGKNGIGQNQINFALPTSGTGLPNNTNPGLDLKICYGTNCSNVAKLPYKSN